MRNLTISHILSIQPYIKAAIYTFEVKICFWSFFGFFIFKLINIFPTRNILWHKRWIKREWIFDICVLMIIISIHLPYTRNLCIRKAFCTKSLFIKSFCYIVNTFKILKLPSSIQELNSV